MALLVSRSQATKAPSLAVLDRVGVLQHTQPNTKPPTKVTTHTPPRSHPRNSSPEVGSGTCAMALVLCSVDRDFSAHGPLAVRLTRAKMARGKGNLNHTQTLSTPHYVCSINNNRAKKRIWHLLRLQNLTQQLAPIDIPVDQLNIGRIALADGSREDQADATGEMNHLVIPRVLATWPNAIVRTARLDGTQITTPNIFGYS